MLNLLLAATIAQQQKPAPPEETKQFAFWVGTWKSTGTLYSTKEPKETPTSGENRITMDMNGFVVHEHFTSKGFNGESWSVYSPQAKKWRQTWVDDAGGYIPLSGEFKDGKMILQTLTNPAKPENASRMVYYNITKDAFDWNWEATADGGKTWTLNWHVHYTRK